MACIEWINLTIGATVSGKTFSKQDPLSKFFLVHRVSYQLQVDWLHSMSDDSFIPRPFIKKKGLGTERDLGGLT